MTLGTPAPWHASLQGNAEQEIGRRHQPGCASRLCHFWWGGPRLSEPLSFHLYHPQHCHKDCLGRHIGQPLALPLTTQCGLGTGQPSTVLTWQLVVNHTPPARQQRPSPGL